MKFSTFLSIVIVCLFVSCAPSVMNYSTEELANGNYAAYKTYAFLPASDTQYTKLVNQKRLVPALAREAKAQLDKKGMRLDTANPDALFTYHLVLNRKYESNRQTETVYNQQVLNPGEIPNDNYSGGISGASAMRAGTAPGSDIYYFSSNNRPYTYSGKMNIDTLRAGSMVIDMIDAKTNKIIWRSIAEGKKQESAMPTVEQAVQRILPAMFKKLPRK